MNLIRSKPNDKFAQRILAFSFAYFAYAKTHRILGKSIGNNSHHNSENFNELLLFIRQLKPEQCLQISNILIEIDSPEPPIMDGSSQFFVEALEKVGIEEQDAPREEYVVKDIISYKDPESGSEIILMPADEYQVTTMVDFGTKILGTQNAS